MNAFLLSTVSGQDTAVTQWFLDQIDKMSKEDAIKHIEKMIDKTIKIRNEYEKRMLAHPFGTDQFNTFRHAWVIDCNNVVRLKKLLDDVRNE